MADAEFVRALDRGLAMFQAFSADTPTLTVSEAAIATGLSRATARRLLHTLEQVDFVRFDGRRYALTAKTLSLGYAYLSSLGIGPIAQPRIDALAATLEDSVTIATFSSPHQVCVARADPDRILVARIMVGTARPPHSSSLGKVLLAHLPDDQLRQFFATAELTRFTSHTITDESRLRAELATVRDRGWSTSEEEVEAGVLSVGAPLRRRNQVVAAINAQSNTARMGMSELEQNVLPHLLEAAGEISAELDLLA